MLVTSLQLASRTGKTYLGKTALVRTLQHSFVHQAPVAVGNVVVLRQFSSKTSTPTPLPKPLRDFSTISIDDVMTHEPGIVTKKLQTLDMSVVQKIKSELLEVDANSDGRIDTDELKRLLRKHNSAFTDDEIYEIGELFYAGKSGGSVSIDKFIEAIDYAAAHATSEGKDLPETGRRPLEVGRCGMEYMNTRTHHGNYTEADLDVKLTHVEPELFRDRLALNFVKAVRKVFDTATGWNNDVLTAHNILNRVIYLETIAAVPGMVAAIVRHFKSLRAMERDGGMLQMFLEEAQNERLHLLSFIRMKNPGTLFRMAVVGGQFGFGTFFGLAYMISPKFCHRFVGYVEEEACSTYTKIIKAIEEAPEGSELAAWRTERAPKIALSYWKLGENGTVLDLMYAVRADEAEHRDVNHLVSGMQEGQINPLYDPQAKLDLMLLKYVKDLMAKN